MHDFCPIFSKKLHFEYYEKTKSKGNNLVRGFLEEVYANPKKTKLSSFKTLEGVRSESLKSFFGGESLKVLHAVQACKITYATI